MGSKIIDNLLICANKYLHKECGIKMKKLFLLTLIFLIAISQSSTLSAFATVKDLGDLESKLTVYQEEDEFVSYRIEENGFVHDYEERTVGDVVHTKKYRVLQSSRILVEDTSTTVTLNGDILKLSIYDNINNTSDTIELNANSFNAVPEYTEMAKCSEVWPAGFTGKKTVVAGHQYAHNWTTKEGISRLGTKDIVVKLPDREFDEYTRIVDDLIAQEKAAIPIVGTVQGLKEVMTAIGNKKVSLETLKKALKVVGKSVPVIGQVWTLVQYFNKAHDANVARDALKGTTKWRLGNC